MVDSDEHEMSVIGLRGRVWIDKSPFNIFVETKGVGVRLREGNRIDQSCVH